MQEEKKEPKKSIKEKESNEIKKFVIKKSLGEKIVPYLSLFTVIITAYIASISYKAIKESRKQSEIIMESYRHIQRAILILEEQYTNSDSVLIKPCGKFLYVSSWWFKGLLKNFGPTPAYPKLVFWYMDSTRKKIDVVNEFPLNDSTFNESMRFYNIDYPSIIYNQESIILRFTTINVPVNINNNTFYIHIYFVFEDVFHIYHQVYISIPYIIKKHGIARRVPTSRDERQLTDEEILVVNEYISKL